MSLFGKKCEYCGKGRTKRQDENGKYICPSCVLEKKAKQEPERKCPVDGAVMFKEIQQGLVIDRCSKCRGVWLDAGELEALAKALEEDSDDGSGMALGIATGIAIGSSFNS